MVCAHSMAASFGANRLLMSCGHLGSRELSLDTTPVVTPACRGRPTGPVRCTAAGPRSLRGARLLRVCNPAAVAPGARHDPGVRETARESLLECRAPCTRRARSMSSPIVARKRVLAVGVALSVAAVAATAVAVAATDAGGLRCTHASTRPPALSHETSSCARASALRARSVSRGPRLRAGVRVGAGGSEVPREPGARPARPARRGRAASRATRARRGIADRAGPRRRSRSTAPHCG